jgi:diacylglycerol kinase
MEVFGSASLMDGGNSFEGYQMPKQTETTRYSRHDQIDAFIYAMEGLKNQKARNLRRHKMRMIALAMAALVVGGLIAWLTKL